MSSVYFLSTLCACIPAVPGPCASCTRPCPPPRCTSVGATGRHHGSTASTGSPSNSPGTHTRHSETRQHARALDHDQPFMYVDGRMKVSISSSMAGGMNEVYIFFLRMLCVPAPLAPCRGSVQRLPPPTPPTHSHSQAGLGEGCATTAGTSGSNRSPT